MKMELTEQQKQISTSPKFWEMQERTKKQIEQWKKHPISVEEWMEQMNNRKAFLKSSTPLNIK